MRDDPSYYETCRSCGDDDAIGMSGLCHLCHQTAETAETAADSASGIGSDQAAWQEAAEIK